uniref:MATH domain-containing protein n=1 Tax=Brassica oleracea var. oleracea TaxID=109376 RepID=A0A0D3DZX7_BRAOL
MSMNPKGDKGKNGLSVYVDASAFLPNTAVSSIYEKFKLRLLNQKSTNYVEKPFLCERESGDSYGKAELISLEELKDESKGYLVKDTIVLEAVFKLFTYVSSCLLMFQNVLLFVYVCVMCCLIMDQLVSK